MMKTPSNMFRPVALILILFVLPLAGCSDRSKQEQAAKELAEELKEINRQNREELSAEIESEGGYSMRTERVDRFVDKFENVSDDLPEELRAQMADQAAVLREIKEISLPYEQAFNEYLELGGLDPATMQDEADIQHRIELISVLIEGNERIDAAFPALFMRLGGDKDETEQQLDLVKKIRQTDRDMLPHMRAVLEILRTHWSVSEMGDDDLFYFGENVPDKDIDLYNQHIDLINEIAAEQQRLQRLQIQMMQP